MPPSALKIISRKENDLNIQEDFLLLNFYTFSQDGANGRSQGYCYQENIKH